MTGENRGGRRGANAPVLPASLYKMAQKLRRGLWEAPARSMVCNSGGHILLE